MEVVKGVVVCITSLFIFFGVTSSAGASNESPVASQSAPAVDPVVTQYRQHRRDFASEQSSESSRFASSTRSLRSELESLQKTAEGHQREIAKIRAIRANRTGIYRILNSIESGLRMIQFPMLGAASLFMIQRDMLDKVFYFFLIVLAINLFIYLARKEKSFFSRYKWVASILLVFFLSVFSLQLFAAETAAADKLMNKLELTRKVLQQSDYQRYLSILKSRSLPVVELPPLTSGDPLLKVYPRVKIDTAEYWVTLAALQSHENALGDAVGSIKTIATPSVSMERENRSDIIVNSVKFLIAHSQSGAAKELLNARIGELNDVSGLLDLSVYLKGKEMQVTAETVLDRAVKLSRNVDDLIALAHFFFKENETDKGADALQKALKKVYGADDLMVVARAAIKYGQDQIIRDLLEQAWAVTQELQDQVRLADVFLDNGRREDAASIFTAMIKHVNKGGTNRINGSRMNNKDSLLYISDQALERQMLEQAVNAVGKLALYLGPERNELIVDPSDSITAGKNLPQPDQVALPLYYGLLNEKMAFSDKAESAYIGATIHMIDKILGSYGYQLPENFNSMHLLGDAWAKASDSEKLAKLDQVYTLLEQKYLSKLREQHNAEQQSLRQQIAELKRRNRQAIEEISAEKASLSDGYRGMIKSSLRIIAVILFYLLILIGCLLIARRYARQQSGHRTYGFLTKLSEALGWVSVMSILNAPLGLLQVFASQFLQIFQRNHEENHIVALAMLQNSNLSQSRAKQKGE